MTPFEKEFLTKLLVTMIILLLFVFVLASCSPTVVTRWKCPSLSPAPLSAVDALVKTSETDASTAAWVVDLDRHYQKCDLINGQK